MKNRLALFIPTSATARIVAIVASRSAIVGPAVSDESECVTVDYEGAIHKPANVKTYADRAQLAAGRHIKNYPTVARCAIPQSDLRQVGWFDPENGITLFDNAKEAVASWLGVEEIDPKELHFSDCVPRLPQSLPNNLFP